MGDKRRTITGDQIKDGTITSTDISGSVISGQTLITSVDTSNDHLLILDATDGALKKVAPGNLGLGSGGSGISHDGSTADGVLTYKDSDEATVESNLTFDGSTLTVAGDILVNQYIKHNGDLNTWINFTDNRIRLHAGGNNFIDCEDPGSAPHKVRINNGGNNIDFVIKNNSGNVYFMADASTSRVGIGTDTPSAALHLSNTSTDDLLLLESTESSSTASPVFKLKRNSSSPADADYLGQIKFAGENDADQEVNYAKITGKIDDASDGSEDGIIEFANIKAGSQTITARLKSDTLQLLNSTGLTVDGSVGIGTTSPTESLDIDGDSIRLRQSKTPSSSSATGTAGQIAWDTNYIYICVATDTWKRVAVSTW